MLTRAERRLMDCLDLLIGLAMLGFFASAAAQSLVALLACLSVVVSVLVLEWAVGRRALRRLYREHGLIQGDQ